LSWSAVWQRSGSA